MNEPYDSLTAVLTALAEQLEGQLEERGWDQPATLWQISLSDDTPPEHLEQQADELGGLAMRLEVAHSCDLVGHPYDALVGRRIDDDALGVALSTEGWNYSAASRAMAELGPLSYPPSGDPERTEVRIMTVVLRDGTTASVFRERGQAQAQVLAQRGGGRVDAALRRMVGLPSGLEPDEPSDVVVRRLLAYAVALFLNRAATNKEAMDLLRQALKAGLSELDADGQAAVRAVLDDPAAAYALAVNTAWVTLLDQNAESLLEGAPGEVVALLSALPGDSVGGLVVSCLEPDLPYPAWDELASHPVDGHLGWFDGGLLAHHVSETAPSAESVAELIDTVSDLGLVSDVIDILRSLNDPTR